MTEKVVGSVFNVIENKIAERKGLDIIPLHIGDAYYPVAAPAGLAQGDVAGLERYGIYAPTQGLPAFREWLATKVATVNRIPGVTPDWIQVTAGATNAIWSTFRGLLAPGDEVLLTAPWWPVITTVCDAAGVAWKEVPLYLEATGSAARDLDALLEGHLTPKTRALYLSSPNNPSGVVLAQAQLEAIAAFARRHDLLVMSDEAYEDFVFTEKPHVSIAALPGMAERTVSAFSFSKVCAASGYRLGYAVAPPERIAVLNRMVTGSIYNAPTPAQGLVHAAMLTKDSWFPERKARYREGWELVRRELQAPLVEAEGGFFVFADLRRQQGDGDVWSLVDRLLDAGVAVAPGGISGPSFDGYVRICFVAVEPERLREGVARINRVLAD